MDLYKTEGPTQFSFKNIFINPWKESTKIS